MSKEPRSTTPSTGRPAARPGTSPARSGRVGRRERSRATVKPAVVERYRTLLIGAVIVAVVAVVGAGLFSAATQSAYACSTIWEPEPTATPASGSSPQPGYVQPDTGQGHVAGGTRLTYTYCPPASGRHFGEPAGPITARLYGPGDGVLPQGWVHNLEHGGMVIVYRDENADQAALRAAFDAIGPSPVCGFEPGGQSPGPVIARFSDMAWPFAAIVWDRVLPLDTLDVPAILEFYATYGERTNPEKYCEPSPSPSASASAAPSASPSGSTAPASASPAPSESTAPSASPS